MQFTVIDTKTGEYPELSKIARTEDWAKNLVYCDVEGFYIGEDGNLVLVDDCGNMAYPPTGRFIIKPEETDTCVAETLNEELNDIVREVKAENVRLTAERDAEKRRGDAAVSDMETLLGESETPCNICKEQSTCALRCFEYCASSWEWRGPCSSNTDAPTGAESEKKDDV